MFRFIIILISVLAISQEAFRQEIEVKNPWMRPGAKGMNSALYFELYNKQAENDTLFSVKSNLAKVTEMHETYQKGDMMGMRKVNFIVIKPHSAFAFKPGGHHIMLISLQKDLKTGDKGIVTLKFKKAGEIKVTAAVQK